MTEIIFKYGQMKRFLEHTKHQWSEGTVRKAIQGYTAVVDFSEIRREARAFIELEKRLKKVMV